MNEKQEEGPKKEEKVIEIKFDSSKEKVFVFLRPNVTLDEMEILYNLLKTGMKNKIIMCPADYVESVKVIKDVKE